MRQFSRKKRVPEIRQRNHRQPLFWLLIWQEEQATNLLHIWRGVRPTQVFFFPSGKNCSKIWAVLYGDGNTEWGLRAKGWLHALLPSHLPKEFIFRFHVVNIIYLVSEFNYCLYRCSFFFFSTPFIVSEPSFFGLPLWTEDQRLPRLSISLGILNYSSSWMRH